MQPRDADRSKVIDALEEHGGIGPDAVRKAHEETRIPEADIYGVATFYTLLRNPDATARVCKGLPCKLKGSDALAARLQAEGHNVDEVSCLGQCDRAPAALDASLELTWCAPRGSVTPDDDGLAINLGGADDAAYAALAQARAMGASAVIDALKAAGLQGRGGAGFPAHIKWRAVRGEDHEEKYVVVNADESEPATFKDREIMLRRPHRMLEGMAIAAFATGCRVAYIYVRGEFAGEKRSLDAALVEAAGYLGDLEVRIVRGHGAYICGEETALLEAIEGRRGMPRLKPPYPTQAGLFGKPTLVNNVETLACVPNIILRGGEWFRALGRGEPGTKLYCISGHVQQPGVYELPLGATLDELVDAAGGPVGTLKAFSPGGAASGFLPIVHRDAPLDFRSLSALGSMVGSSGVVVLNDTVDMAVAARAQQVFFEEESCGQCVPCRVGARLQRLTLDRYLKTGDREHLAHAEDVHWEMEEGSICGLGTTASLPLVTAMRHFPQDFRSRQEGE